MQGNPGKRPVNNLEPRLPVARPPMPADLDQDAAAEWERLCAVCLNAGVLTAADRGIVEMAAHAYSTFIRMTRLLNAEGHTYKSESVTKDGDEKVTRTLIKTHPGAAIASDAWRRYRAAMCELGLTPAARTRVEAADQVDTDPNGAGYFN